MQFSNRSLSFRVNVDVQSRAVSPVGVLSSTVNPEKLPASRDFIINITEVKTNFLILFLEKCGIIMTHSWFIFVSSVQVINVYNCL